MGSETESSKSLEVFLKKYYSFCQVNRLSENDLFVVSIFTQLEKRKIYVFDMTILGVHGIPRRIIQICSR